MHLLSLFPVLDSLRFLFIVSEQVLLILNVNSRLVSLATSIWNPNRPLAKVSPNEIHVIISPVERTDDVVIARLRKLLTFGVKVLSRL